MNEKFLFKRLSGGAVTVLNAFPNTYEVGMASLGYQSVFKLYASNPKTHTFRYFTNFQEIVPKRIDLITFSVSWELDFLNVLKILEELRIPLKASDRGAEDPLVLAGGPVVTANPEPWAEFFDLISIGDSEVNTSLIIDEMERYINSSNALEKRDLKSFTKIPGLYVPGLSNRTERVKATKQELQSSSVIAPDSVWKDVGLLEVVRSCPEMCRFCLASYAALPFRVPDLEGDLIPKVSEMLEHTNQIGLLGASVTQHPEFIDLLKFLSKHPKQPQIQVASVRASTVSQEMCELLVSCGVKNLTIAIESGSERLRDIINKKLPQEAIYSAARFASAAKMKQLKLYGMVGLPHETDEDIEATIDLLVKLKTENKALKIVWGCSVFTPKAQTPFQDYGVDPNAEAKLKKFSKALKAHAIEFRDESYKWAQVQALISRGDRTLSEVMLKVYQVQNTGHAVYRKLMKPEDYKHFVFDQWHPEKPGFKYPWHLLVSEKQAQMLEEHKKHAAAIN